MQRGQTRDDPHTHIHRLGLRCFTCVHTHTHQQWIYIYVYIPEKLTCTSPAIVHMYINSLGGQTAAAASHTSRSIYIPVPWAKKKFKFLSYYVFFCFFVWRRAALATFITRRQFFDVCQKTLPRQIVIIYIYIKSRGCVALGKSPRRVWCVCVCSGAMHFFQIYISSRRARCGMQAAQSRWK